MPNYKSVKILFDISDEYQNKLYKHLKERTNGSSYIRSLIHQDIFAIPHDKQYPVFKEPNVPFQPYVQPTIKDVITEQKLSNSNSIKQVEEVTIDDIDINDLI